MVGGDVAQEVFLWESLPAVDLQSDEAGVLRVREEDCPCLKERAWFPAARYGETKEAPPKPVAGDLRADLAVAVRRRHTVAGLAAVDVQNDEHPLRLYACT